MRADRPKETVDRAPGERDICYLPCLLWLLYGLPYFAPCDKNHKNATKWMDEWMGNVLSAWLAGCLAVWGHNVWHVRCHALLWRSWQLCGCVCVSDVAAALEKCWFKSSRPVTQPASRPAKQGGNIKLNKKRQQQDRIQNWWNLMLLIARIVLQFKYEHTHIHIHTQNSIKHMPPRKISISKTLKNMPAKKSINGRKRQPFEHEKSSSKFHHRWLA